MPWFEHQLVEQASGFSIVRYVTRTLPTGLHAGRFAPTFFADRIARAEVSDRGYLPDSTVGLHREGNGLHASVGQMYDGPTALRR